MTYETEVSRGISLSVAIFATLFPLIAITQQSLWIDEALTATFIKPPSLPLLWHKMATSITSEVQMPLYIVYGWSWQKLFGGSEVSLRLANYPWFLLGQFAGAFIWTDRRKQLLFLAIAASSSFIWLYLNEARPYLMVYGAACVLLWFIASLLRDGSLLAWKYWVFSFGTITLAGAHMLGALWVGMSLLVAAAILAKNRLRPPLVPVIVGAIGLLALGIYYLWKLSNGARATYANQTILNVLYVFYELAGFSGLGPGRLDIREHSISSFFPFLVPLSLYGLVVLSLLLCLWSVQPRVEGRRILVATAAFALPPLFFLSIAGTFVQFSVLGRHVIPAVLFVFVLLTFGCEACLMRKASIGRFVVAAFFLLSIGSCFGLRLFPWHLRDDYRGAVAAVFSILQENEVAWWCASKEGAEYYQAPIDETPDGHGRLFIHVRNPREEDMKTTPAPAVVALSKRDVYDEKGKIATKLEEEHFVRRKTLPAFTIWERPR